MVQHNITIGYRNILKNKIFSLINIFGLVIGIVASVLIFRYVDFEKSYDDFHINGKNIYRIAEDIEEGEIRKTILTAPPLGPGLNENFPDVINHTRLILPWSGQGVSSTLNWQNRNASITKHSFYNGFYTDPGFLKLFSFPWIKGNQQTALVGSNKVVLAESTVRKIFGDDWMKNENIIGQTLEYVNEFDRFQLTISGIISDAPENSHFQYDFLASFTTLSAGWAIGYAERWDGNRVYTYLHLEPNTDINLFTNKVLNYFKDNRGDNLVSNTNFVLQPLKDIYLNSHREGELKVNGNATYVAFLSLIAIIILLIALINYINLTTSNAITRGHEVGLKKVLGASRTQLIKQFLFESLLINAFAFFLAIVLLHLIFPYMNELSGKSVTYKSTEFWRFILILFPVSTILSGLYPAFVLSSYDPLKTLKSKLIRSPKGSYIQKYLVVAQFWISICLVIFTFTIYRQLDYMRSQDTGFNKEGIIVVKGPINRNITWIEHDKAREAIDLTDLFKNFVSQYSEIESVTLSWSVPGEQNSIYSINLGAHYNNGKLDVIKADNDFAQVYGLKLIAGEFNTYQGIVINESATAILGFSNPTLAIGKEFRDDRNRERIIHGVIADYHHHSLQQEILPMMFAENDPSYKLDSYYSLKVVRNNLKQTIENISLAYKKAYPHDPFEYYFMDSFFDAQYRADIRFGKLFGFFSGIAIFIACLGLFGLSLHTVAIKTKEIGIRKVLGASKQIIFVELTKNVILLIIISCLLALPFAYWITHNWLSNYAYSIELGWLFFLSAFLVPVVVLFSVSFLSFKLTNLNPAITLRNE